MSSAVKKTRTPKKRSLPKKTTPSLSVLEEQLLHVMERPGATILHASLVCSRKKDRARPTGIPSASLRADPVSALDRALSRARPSVFFPKAKQIPIHFETHRPSPYAVSLGRVFPAFQSLRQDRSPLRMHEWLAPFEMPPSLEQLVAWMRDLYVEEIDPRSFFDQFTPRDPRAAAFERFHWWARIRAPFIRWEVRPVDVFSDQFTSKDPARAFQDSYGALRGLRSWMQERRNRRALPVSIEDEAMEEAGETEGAWQPPALEPRLRIGRVLAGFVGLILLVSLPAGAVTFARSFQASTASLQRESYAALADVEAALTNQGGTNFEAWRRASDRFRAADRALSDSGSVILSLSQVLPKARDARALLRAGERAAQSARLLAEGVEKAWSQSALYPDERLLTLSLYLDAAAKPLEQASGLVGKVSLDRLPKDLQPKVEVLRSLLASSQSSLRDLRAITQLLIAVSGHEHIRSHLFIFQNQTELRPTGGFMGSLAYITFDRGAIKSIVVPGGGPYDFRDQLLARVTAPKPLQLVASRWELQDANWFPDFAASAKKIMWFWSASGQPTIDGVIAVNERLMERLLAITGPIEMPEYGKVITAENFLLETQKAVELEYDREENKPKKFIGDLLPKILARLEASSREEWPAYLAVMSEALTAKDVQVYLADPEEDAVVKRFGWRGELKPVKGDALAIVSANIAGQKTDAVIQEEVTHQAVVDEDGHITDTVTLVRRHTGQKGELFRGANNVEYVRVYVPTGSELLEASGFRPPPAMLFKATNEEDKTDADLSALVTDKGAGPGGVAMTDEFGRTAFGGWIQLSPGAVATTTFRYRLPFSAFDLAREALENPEPAVNARAAYLLLLTSQSGKPDRFFKTSVTFPKTWNSVWQSQAFRASTSSLAWSGALDQDRVFAGLFHLSSE